MAVNLETLDQGYMPQCQQADGILLSGTGFLTTSIGNIYIYIYIYAHTNTQRTYMHTCVYSRAFQAEVRRCNMTDEQKLYVLTEKIHALWWFL